MEGLGFKKKDGIRIIQQGGYPGDFNPDFWAGYVRVLTAERLRLDGYPQLSRLAGETERINLECPICEGRTFYDQGTIGPWAFRCENDRPLYTRHSMINYARPHLTEEQVQRMIDEPSEVAVRNQREIEEYRAEWARYQQGELNEHRIDVD